MALTDYNSNSYDPSMGFGAGIRGIGTSLMMMPAMRAMAAQRLAMAQYQQQHAVYEQAATDEANARTGLFTSQKTAQDNDNSGHVEFAGALKKLAVNPNDTDAIGEAFEGAGKGFKSDPENTMKALGLLFTQIQARNGTGNLQEQAVMQGGAAPLAVQQAKDSAMAALPATSQVVIPTGGTLASRITGQPIAQGGVTLAPGAERFAPTGGTVPPSGVPEDSGAPLPPRTTAAQTTRNQLASKLLELSQQPGSSLDATNIAPILETYDKFTDAGASPTAPTAAGQPSPTGATPAPQMVRVQHPNGQTGTIPASQLQDALSQGYKQIQ